MKIEQAKPVHDSKPAVDLKRLLRQEFIKRTKKNSAYSLRAYARFLGIDQSLLSKIMRGNRKISNETAKLIGFKLGVKPSLIGKYLIKPSLNVNFLQLEDDEFETISAWYHFAILELIKTKDFVADPGVIAKRIGIHVEEVRSALDRLQRIGLIRIEKKGKIKLNSNGNTWTNTASTNDARKLLQKALLQKAYAAIEDIPFEDRENGSLTIAIDKRRLPEFKEKLKQVRHELGTFFQKDSNLNEVYQLTISFFPLTKPKGSPHE